MALAQPTPISNTVVLDGTHERDPTDNFYHYLLATILDIPGPTGSFAVIDLNGPIPYSNNANVSFELFIGNRLLTRGPILEDNESSNSGVSNFKIKSIVVPGGESLIVRYNKNGYELNKFFTATGLFYKAS